MLADWRLRWFDPGAVHLRTALIAMGAVLATYGSALMIEHYAHLHVDAVIQSVALALSAARVQRRVDSVDRLVGFVVLPVTAMAATWIGRLMVTRADLGDALFVLGIALSVWVRRFGPRATRAGTVLVLPFVAVLITQGPAARLITWSTVLWSAVIALVACSWVTMAWFLAARTGFLRSSAPIRSPPRRPAARRVSPSTRMALQMGAALGATFVVGRILWPQHWPWAVLTAFIVCSGARDRGDVLLKGTLRALGAAIGTVVAAMIAGSFGPHADGAVVVMFIGLAVATWLREASYAYWAGTVTAVLSLLYDWLGESSGELLSTRLAGILVGAVFGIAASWLILPIRTGEVLRRRTSDALAALGDILVVTRDAQQVEATELRRRQIRFDHSVELLEQIARPLRTRRALESKWGGDRYHQADIVDQVRGCLSPVATLTDLLPRLNSVPACVTDIGAVVSGNALAVRQAIGHRSDIRYQAAMAMSINVSDCAPTVVALFEIDSRLAELAAAFAPAHPAPDAPTSDLPESSTD